MRLRCIKHTIRTVSQSRFRIPVPLQIWGWLRVFWGWQCHRWRAPLASGRTPQPAHQNIFISVPDPWHFGVDPDPDPRIHASDLCPAVPVNHFENPSYGNIKNSVLRIRIRMRILLFSSLTFKFFCILLFEGTWKSFFKGKKSKISLKTVEIKVFLTNFALW